MRSYLGVDGGGSKTRFLLIDEGGTVLGSHSEGPAYYLEIGLDALQAMLLRGIQGTLQRAGVSADDLTFAFLGLPAYGEDRALLPVLDAAPAAALPHRRYRCGNDMVCGWAGALAGADGINIVAGTGSIAYGEYAGRSARAGGWGELFGDEGSAYWLAREGLRLFARMSDGRTPRGALYERVRQHFALEDDLDLCAAVYGKSVTQRSQFARLSKLVAEAAGTGDEAARALFAHAAIELADMVDAVRDELRVPADEGLPVSYSGGVFGLRDLLLVPLAAALRSRRRYRLLAARLSPDAGAALHAAKLSGTPLQARCIAALEDRLRGS
ncbi:MAG: N-acetylglucosamine kinase [Acidobacteria bacterium 13_1_20CM_3_58_11]|nr:MAG: N-acetylglucosamine kinase [Acidobacteria bacterium 13_1_20CM_3_58_11]